MSDEDFEDEPHKKGVLGDRAKGIIVGAASALAIAGLVYAIVQEEKPKASAKHAAPALTSEEPLDQDLFAESPVEAAEVEVTETPTEEGKVKITSVLKDVSTVGAAAHGLAMLEPVAEALIALL